MLCRSVLFSSIALAVFALNAPAQVGAVHVVVNGMNLQAVVNGAQSGDTLLIQAGVYPGGATIDGKGLTLAADGPGEPLLDGGVRIANVGAGQRVVLSGLKVEGEAWTGPNTGRALAVESTAGAVRLDRCVFLGRELGHGATLQGAPDFVATECVFRGGSPATWSSSLSTLRAGSGLTSSGSAVALYASQLRGASGLDAVSVSDGQAGGDAAALSGGRFHAALSAFRGGQGGLGSGTCMFGGAGGNGLVVQAPLSARAIASTFTKGNGAAGGPCFCILCVEGDDGVGLLGPVATLAGPVTQLEFPRVAREATTVNVMVASAPGAVGFLFASQNAAHTSNAAYNGPILVKGPYEVRTPLGALPSGSTTLSLQLPTLPPGVESQTWFVQALVRSPTGGTFAGECRPLVIVDDAF